jgi:hypothetical protein
MLIGEVIATSRRVLLITRLVTFSSSVGMESRAQHNFLLVVIFAQPIRFSELPKLIDSPKGFLRLKRKSGV